MACLVQGLGFVEEAGNGRRHDIGLRFRFVHMRRTIPSMRLAPPCPAVRAASRPNKASLRPIPLQRARRHLLASVVAAEFDSRLVKQYSLKDGNVSMPG